MQLASYGDHAIDLANTWSPNTDPDELLPDVAAARAFLDGRAPGAATADEEDLAVLHEARRTIRHVLTTPEAADAVEHLNRLLRAHPVHPLVSGHDGGNWHLHLHQDDRRPGELLVATAAFGLAVGLLEAGMDRRGQCGATDCDDVFVDTSRNHSRRYCSATCSNRTNVAAHRARQRTTES